jgi:hypothetical protein
MSSQDALATAAQEWRRLWSVGANGENIPEYRKKKKRKANRKQKTTIRTYTPPTISLSFNEIYKETLKNSLTSKYLAPESLKKQTKPYVSCSIISTDFPSTADQRKASN